MTKSDRIKGFPVLVLAGKEISANNPQAIQAVRKTNGPHHDAKWARDLTGTNFTAKQRRKQFPHN